MIGLRVAVSFIIMSLLSLAVLSAAGAAEPALVDQRIRVAVDPPVQTGQPDIGVVDMLLELRAERPGSSLLVLTHFPQGFSAEVDTAITAFAGALHAQSYADVRERGAFSFERLMGELAGNAAALSKASATRDRDWENTFADITTYVVHRPARQYVSVLFRQDSLGGGAHGNWSYHAASYDLVSGRPLGVRDIFPEAESLRAVLEPRVAASLAELRKETSFVGGAQAVDYDITMERLVLNADGMLIMYAPYEIASFAEGEFTVSLSRRELLDLGANPTLWDQGAGD